MELSVIVGYFVAAILGFLIGVFLVKKKPDGVLKVDVSDPKKDRYLMEFHIPLDIIPSKKTVLLTVTNVVSDEP